jgi:hypothetical protein
MVAFAIPIKANSRDLQAAIWVVGLTRQVPNSSIQELTELLKRGLRRDYLSFKIKLNAQKIYKKPAQPKKQ